MRQLRRLRMIHPKTGVVQLHCKVDDGIHNNVVYLLIVFD